MQKYRYTGRVHQKHKDSNAYWVLQMDGLVMDATQTSLCMMRGRRTGAAIDLKYSVGVCGFFSAINASAGTRRPRQLLKKALKSAGREEIAAISIGATQSAEPPLQETALYSLVCAKICLHNFLWALAVAVHKPTSVSGRSFHSRPGFPRLWLENLFSSSGPYSVQPTIAYSQSTIQRTAYHTAYLLPFKLASYISCRPCYHSASCCKAVIQSDWNHSSSY